MPIRHPLITVISGMALAGAAHASDGVLRLACVAPAKADPAQVETLCRIMAEGMAERSGRAVERVTEGPDVSLEVLRLAQSLAVARLVWSGQAAGREVEVNRMDSALSDESYRRMAAALLDVSPPP